MINAPYQSPRIQFITGRYRLNGINDTVSEFEFFSDNTFLFNYNYSAISRKGKGTYMVNDKSVILKNNSASDNDFKLASSRLQPQPGFTVKINDDNLLMRSYVACCVSTPDGIVRMKVNEEGIASFNVESVKSILLIHLLYPDRTSIFDTGNSNHNYFEFTIDPMIIEIQFNNLNLKMNGNKLSGGHPLLEGSQFTYSKED